jgi:hypothetical protein
MDPKTMTTEQLTTAVAGRLAEVWAVLDRLAVGMKVLLAAEQAGDLERVARVNTRLAEVELLIADYRELERRSSGVPINKLQEVYDPMKNHPWLAATDMTRYDGAR